MIKQLSVFTSEVIRVAREVGTEGKLGGKVVDPLADMLLECRPPFLFITGYRRDSIDRRHAHVPVLVRPIDVESLERVLDSPFDAPVRAAAST
jgi:hypothetical protein